MSTLDATRAELGLIVVYLNKAEARGKLCRTIQYGYRFLSNGQPDTAQNVEKSTTLARKVFCLYKDIGRPIDGSTGRGSPKCTPQRTHHSSSCQSYSTGDSVHYSERDGSGLQATRHKDLVTCHFSLVWIF